jgi:hypothetical protein
MHPGTRDLPIYLRRDYEKANEYLNNKIKNAKSEVDFSCPLSFAISKSKSNNKKLSADDKLLSLNKSMRNLNIDSYQDYENKKQNVYLFKKLTKIYVSDGKKSPIQLKKEIKNYNGKWELLKITQENARLNRKIIESKSIIKDCLMSKTNGFTVWKKTDNEHKKLINFNELPEHKLQEDVKAKTNEDFFKLKRTKKKHENINESNMNNSVYDKLILPKTSDEKEEEKNYCKILYRRKAFVNNLALVDLKFMIYSKK